MSDEPTAARPSGGFAVEAGERVRSRTGHGFTDRDPACHMYRELSNAIVADRHVIPSEGPAEAVASLILEMVLHGSLLRTIERSSLCSS